MAKETMTERNSNPAYYETIFCSVSGCGRTEDLLKHRYSDEMTCVTCVNAMVEKIEEQKRIEEEEFERHDDYRDFSYNQLLTERCQ